MAKPIKTRSAAFTLVELLVVIVIIGILAALIIPAVARARENAKIQQARIELNELVTSITRYEAVYGRFPVSTEAMQSTGGAGDFTFGSAFKDESGVTFMVGSPGIYQTNNAEVMAILMDVENYRSGVPTVNRDHVKNPQRIRFLNPKPAEEETMSGVDTNGVYRDPWGSLYIVSVDLNNDGRTRDGFYSLAEVSQDPGSPDRGLYGLVLTTEGNGNFFEVPTPVIAWSIGPDRKIHRNGKANEKENRDNILSWR